MSFFIQYHVHLHFRVFLPFTHGVTEEARECFPLSMAARLMAPELINWAFSGLSMTDDADTRHWQTHNIEAYKRPQTQGSNRRKHQHSNISQWDLGYGSDIPPDAHYRTANNIQFSTAHPVKRAPERRSEQYAESFERTRVPIGSTKCARAAAPPHTTRCCAQLG